MLQLVRNSHILCPLCAFTPSSVPFHKISENLSIADFPFKVNLRHRSCHTSAAEAAEISALIGRP
ncbi:hypothetical protein CLOM621_06038 [Clostridium sp. M62/1]|nr:hypothetical protein CLOM621_06038 [Clostridium sp. M62/1]